MPGPQQANVQSLDALRDVRLALIAFQERASTALGELRSKIDRTVAWLEEDRPLYWSEQERRAYDGVASARVAYETCRLRTVGGRHPECIEEKVALARAKDRLAYCQQKRETVRRCVAEARHQVDGYRGRIGPLQRQVDDGVPNMIALIGRMIDAVEAYADTSSSALPIAFAALSTPIPVAPVFPKTLAPLSIEPTVLSSADDARFENTVPRSTDHVPEQFSESSLPAVEPNPDSLTDPNDIHFAEHVPDET